MAGAQGRGRDWLAALDGEIRNKVCSTPWDTLDRRYGHSMHNIEVLRLSPFYPRPQDNAMCHELRENDIHRPRSEQQRSRHLSCAPSRAPAHLHVGVQRWPNKCWIRGEMSLIGPTWSIQKHDKCGYVNHLLYTVYHVSVHAR